MEVNNTLIKLHKYTEVTNYMYMHRKSDPKVTLLTDYKHCNSNPKSELQEKRLF